MPSFPGRMRAVAGGAAAFLRSLPQAGRAFLAAWLLAAAVMAVCAARLAARDQEVVIIHEDGTAVVLKAPDLEVVAGDRFVIGDAEEDAAPVRIRLHGVACPEKDAPGWAEAADLADALLSDAERLTVVVAGRGRIGVLPAVVGMGAAEDGGTPPGGSDAAGMDPGRRERRRMLDARVAPLRTLQEVLVAEGLARVEESGCPERFCDGWRRLQDEARSAGLGMWGDGPGMAPDPLQEADAPRDPGDGPR